MGKDSDVSAEEKNNAPKFNKLSFTIPKAPQPPIQKKSHKKQKLDIEIKREPKKTAQEYLDILKKLDILLNQPCLSEARRNGYCKSQRYFMKLYLNMLDGS